MANSTSELIGDTAKTAIEAIGLTRPATPGPTEAVPVIKRKLPGIPEGDASGLPQIVVSVGDEGPTEYLTATQKLKTYPVTAVIVTGTGAITGDDAPVREWREKVEKELDKRTTWAGVSGWNRVSIRNLDPFERAAMQKDLVFSAVVAVVEVIEART